ncbi:hypothetical protein ACWCSD_51455, partial [Nonomuraea sp. NPDC001684]
ARATRPRPPGAGLRRGGRPVVDIPGQDTGVMDTVVTEAARLASPGDTVLLSPAGASLDMFPGYPARGEAFARAVHELRRRREQ